MLSNEVIEQQLSSLGEVSYVRVEGDGYHYHITLVSDVFKGLSAVKRQQWVYAQLKEKITSGELHAVNMKTWTTEEWEKKNG